jgi:predicted acylesterase/phospholipase RssA
VARLDRERVAELAGDEPQLGVALAHVLDRIESGHDTVLLSAPGRPGDEWMDACLRQTDRILLFVDGDTDRWAHEPRLSGCDVVLLGPADRAPVTRLLDALDPRSTHRVRDEADVGRLARRIAGRSVGLVLSGGWARAFAHLGVVDELLAAGIVIDRVGGVSMGAFVGALLAQGLDADAIEECCYREFVRRNPMGDYRIPRVSLLRGGRVEAMLTRTFPGLIEDLPRSFYCVTTDMVTGELVVHRRGDLRSAVRASMSTPGVFPPVSLGARLLLDGGVLDNLPIEVMAAEAEGPIIASDVTQPEQRNPAPGGPVPEVGLVDTLARVMFLGAADTEELGRRHAALYIRPDHEGVGRLEFHQLDAMRDAGRRAALAALENAPASLF